MHFLLVNDDGLNAPGILAMANEILRCGHTFRCCAPDRERSAASHGFSLNTPLHPVLSTLAGQEAYALDGTPADCAYAGLWLYRDEKFDMAISGINNGTNLGTSCIYSGTVGAAMEASQHGAPAIASSIHVNDDYETAAAFTLRFALWAIEHPLPRGDIYNLNFPWLNLPYHPELQIAKLAPMFMGTPRLHPSPEGYRIADGAGIGPDVEGQDDYLNRQGYITVTPVTWNCVSACGMDQPDLTL